jgi:hypothetical protein
MEACASVTGCWATLVGDSSIRFTPHIGVFSEATWNVVDGPKNNFLQVNFGARFAF